MALNGLRSKLRSLASSGSESARDVSEQAPERIREARAKTGKLAQRRAPASGLEGQQRPRAPTSRERIAQRLQGSGEMRKPVQDANLQPAADPRFVEAFGRGDANVRSYFGENGNGGDPYTTAAARGTNTVLFGTFAEEMIDERDHEGGLYAYRDEREEGYLDDGIDVGDILGGRF